ncbi:MAG: adenylosuccinate synthetase, partial [Parcubacteria group bacterium]|nr:adenylosuccinate synthetase [Parcubacteria group bacterium]
MAVLERPLFLQKGGAVVVEKKAFIVTGLGYGDEGKGTVTHWLSSHYEAHTVIRTGGPQALHRIVTKNRAEHVFSQFGSGTLRGSTTHLSSQMIIDPHAILGEGEHLKYAQGIHNVFDMLTIHEDAIVITPFQAIAGRLRELLRGDNRHGSVGIGVGETVLDAEMLGNVAIRVKDLVSPHLREKLHVIRQQKLITFEEIRDRASFIPSEAREQVRREMAELEDLDTIEWA